MIELITNIFTFLLAFTLIWIIPGIIISAIITVEYLFTHKSPIYIKDIKNEYINWVVIHVSKLDFIQKSPISFTCTTKNKCNIYIDRPFLPIYENT